MTSVTAADYGWIRSSSSLFAYGLEVGYTLTLVRGVSPSEVFRIVGAEPQDACQGLNELIEAQQEFLDGYEEWPEAFLAGAFTARGEGGTGLSLWSSEAIWARDRASWRHSPPGRVPSRIRATGKPMDFFHWYEEGELRTTFEWPANRTGSTPDELNGLMTEVGLNPSGDEDPDVDRKAAVLALTERLTGVRVTEELLAEAGYQVGKSRRNPPTSGRA